MRTLIQPFKVDFKDYELNLNYFEQDETLSIISIDANTEDINLIINLKLEVNPTTRINEYITPIINSISYEDAYITYTVNLRLVYNTKNNRFTNYKYSNYTVIKVNLLDKDTITDKTIISNVEKELLNTKFFEDSINALDINNNVTIKPM